MNTYVAIMAGGIGSRFWPSSRTHRPKQFLDILGIGKSLIRSTFERFLHLCPKENILIVTNELYKDLVLEHLPELTPEQVLCEPSRNNTAPSVAYTAFKLQAMNPNANFIIAPSDHIILNEIEFIRVAKQALTFAENNDALLTLGIQPSRPDTGYGYINYEKEAKEGIHKVMRFTEKPNLENAKRFLASGDYVWNAGIFIWNVKSIINAFEKHTPEMHSLFDNIKEHMNTPDEQAVINEHYPNSPKISIDYAIMEKADNVYTIPADFGWSDLGTWNSLHAESNKDDANNAISGDKVLAVATQNSMIRTPKDKLVVIKGLDNFIVVDEEDVLLIFPKSDEQEIKQITKTIKAKGLDSFL